MNQPMTKPETPKLVITPAARAVLADDEIYIALTFHSMGDWGEDYECDSDRYDALMRDDVHFLSVFTARKNDAEFWVITKKDKTKTILLPEEY